MSPSKKQNRTTTPKPYPVSTIFNRLSLFRTRSSENLSSNLAQFSSEGQSVNLSTNKNLSIPESNTVNFQIDTKILSVNKSESDLDNLQSNESHPHSSVMATTGNDVQTPQNNNTKLLTVTDVFNSLRVPDAIKDLPKFEGNPRLLFDFLDNVDEILSMISITSGTPYGQLLLRAIRNKIVGPANEVLNMYGTPLDWDKIKENLILHYSDKRNETSLIRDLHKIRQNNNSVEKYYGEVVELLASMTNHVNIHEKDSNVIDAKKTLYSEMCLNAFLSGLREPLGSIIRAMKPQSLAEAFSFCIEEQNMFYSRTDSHKSTPPSKPVQLSHLNTYRNYIQQQIRAQPRPNTQSYAFLPRLSQPQNFAQQQRFPQFNNFFQSQRPQFNNFPSQPRPQFFNRPNQTNQNNSSKPEPMEIDSGNTRINRPQPQNRQPLNNYFRSTGKPNFTSKELFNVTERTPNLNTDDHYAPNIPSHTQSLDDYYYYDDGVDCLDDHNSNNPMPLEFPNNEVDDVNFPQSASINKLDT